MLYLQDHENTYTNSAKNRMVDFLDEYVLQLDTNTQINNYENFLYGKTLHLENKKYRLVDACEVKMCSKTPPTFFEVKMHMDGCQEMLTEMFEEAELTDVKLKDKTYRVELKAPTNDKLDELSGKLKLISRSQISNITKIKAETVQRIQKGVQREFIDTLESAQASREVAKLHDELRQYFQYLGVNAQMKILGKHFKFEEEFTKKQYDRVVRLINGEVIEDDEDDD
ncbi:MAG: hypothetical protein QMB16_09300 [Paracoccaceae bacterium]|jgi:hypothetical protein